MSTTNLPRDMRQKARAVLNYGKESTTFQLCCDSYAISAIQKERSGDIHRQEMLKFAFGGGEGD
jgi:hypothetical protein